MATVEKSTPVLIRGDRLTRDEFLRRWELHPEIKRAELIGGIVYMPSPLGFEHAETDSPVSGIAWLYTTATPGTKSGIQATTLMLEDAPQPDDYIRILPEYGGQCSTEGKLLKGAPEWVGEICATSAAYDLHEKRDLYEQAGVNEYVAFVVATHEVRWHRLGPGGYEIIRPSADAIYRSVVLPGLWVDGEAILAGDMPRVLAVVQQGLASPEHAAFVAALAARRQSP